MSLLDIIAWKAIGVRNRIDDRLIERRLNIRTLGKKEVEQPEAVAYSTFAYCSIFRVLDRLELEPHDVFTDLGCGKGRVVCAAALRPVKKVIGIEVDEDLCQQARENASRLRRRRAPIEIVMTPAQDFDYAPCTVLFLFNPFGYGTLKAVLDSVADSRRRNPRSVRLAYVEPRFDNLLAESGAFEQYDSWPLRPRSRLKFNVSFWRTIER